MAGTRDGAEKAAAKRIGCTIEEWRQRRAAGQLWCCRCRTWKRGKFYGGSCAPCAQAASRAARYGMSVATIAAMERAQGGRCLLCGEVKPLAVDHDHVTGAVRGLLCKGCNTGIGLLREDPMLLRAAARYLESHRGG